MAGLGQGFGNTRSGLASLLAQLSTGISSGGQNFAQLGTGLAGFAPAMQSLGSGFIGAGGTLYKDYKVQILQPLLMLVELQEVMNNLFMILQDKMLITFTWTHIIEQVINLV